MIELNKSNASVFQTMLTGENSFYDKPDYLETTANDFSKKETASLTYTYNSESTLVKIIKLALSIIIFPIGIGRFLHRLIGKMAVLPASLPTAVGYPKNYANILRSQVPLNTDWKYKRFTIAVDGQKVDAVMMGQKSTFNNGRWTLFSNGNCQFYEEQLEQDSDSKKLLNHLNSNAIIFNYPGVAASKGLPSRGAMVKTYRALLKFLEDKKEGIGAQEIIGYGHSIGTVVQAEGLKKHFLKNDIKYVFVKRCPFSSISAVAASLSSKPIGFLSKILGWNMSCVDSSKKLKAPEIIIQSANVETSEILEDSSRIVDDGVIKASVSLGKILLDDKKADRTNKLFIGTNERHNDAISDYSFIAEKIENFLKA